MEKLDVSDVFCYICRSILIQPVSIPCGHVFCLTCFEESMKETSYSCPLCRKRVSNWARAARKTNKLIDENLWALIQKQYPKEVNSKLNGEDDGLDEHYQEKYRSTSVVLSEPGELAMEFKKYIELFSDENRMVREKECQQSLEYISRIQREEEAEIEAQKRLYEKDELFAKQLQNESAKDVPSTSQVQKNSNSKKSNTRKSDKVIGPMDQFINSKTNQPKNGLKVNGLNKHLTNLQEICINDKSRCSSSGSNDSIRSEMHHFKPIQVVPRTPPKQYPGGRIAEVKVTKVTPVKLSSTRLNDTSASGLCNINKQVKPLCKKIQSPYSAFRGERSLPLSDDCKKRLLFCTDEPDNGILKEISLDENNDSNSMSSSPVKNLDCLDMSKNKTVPAKISERENFFQSLSKSKNVGESKISSHLLTNDDENSCSFDTQDYLTPGPSIQNKLIEEQKRIEMMILQEKMDRELALRLSEEWEKHDSIIDRSKGSKRPYELRTSTKKPVFVDRNKRQRTIMESLAKQKNV